MTRLGVWARLGLPLYWSLSAIAVPNSQERLLITAPPNPQATSCTNPNVLKRQQSCRFGQCGDSCLEQGAFCCGPAGTLVTSPYWVCDNGACITSVRGTTGIVDCYDPDNPQGTTQSCIDNVDTTTCKPTDRCYTCSATEPFCRWETYIASNSPTLSWFSCVETKLPDATFFAATITSNNSHATTGSATGTEPTRSGTGAVGQYYKQRSLSTGAIIGIAVGGGTILVGSAALFFYYCCIRQPGSQHSTQELSGDSVDRPMEQRPPPPTELDGRSYERSELNSTAATAYSPQSMPATPFNPSEGHGRTAEEVNMWREGSGLNPVEMQAQKTGEEYYEGPPGELHHDAAMQRPSHDYRGQYPGRW